MLECRNLGVAFGGVTALRGVTFNLHEGGIFGLIGPNGAGKSTFINCVSGSLRPSSGHIRWSGSDLTARRPDKVARLGVSRTFQHARLFPGLTALENVMLGAHLAGRSNVFSAMIRSPRWRRDEREMREAGYTALAAVHVDHLADAVIDDLTAGQQRLIAVARALAGQASLLLLDEPAAGLTDAERNLLAQDLKTYFDNHRATLLIVEHNMGFLLSLVSRIVVFDRGSVLAEGAPDEIRRNQDVIAAYLGDEHAAR